MIHQLFRLDGKKSCCGFLCVVLLAFVTDRVDKMCVNLHTIEGYMTAGCATFVQLLSKQREMRHFQHFGFTVLLIAFVRS